MRIEYLKKMHNADVGDVLDIPDAQARILIKTGAAKPHTPKPAKTAKPTKNDDKGKK